MQLIHKYLVVGFTNDNDKEYEIKPTWHDMRNHFHHFDSSVGSSYALWEDTFCRRMENLRAPMETRIMFLS